MSKSLHETNVELPRISITSLHQPLNPSTQESEEPSKNSNSSVKLFPLLKTNFWFNHGWIYYFYFTAYSLLIKTVGVLFVCAAIKELVYLIIGRSRNDISSIFDILPPYIYGHALIASLCIPLYNTYKHQQEKNESSESQFSFFVENLPKDIPEHELRTRFINSLHSLFQEKGIDGKVRDIIFVQDCKRYLTVQAQLAKIKRQLEELEQKNKTPSTKLLLKQAYCQSVLDMLTEEALNFRLFKGKAILILDSIYTKKLVNDNLRGKYWLWHCFKVPFGDKMVEFSEIYEPSEMRFKNLNQRFWPRFIIIGGFQLLLLTGLYISVHFRVDLVMSSSDNLDPWGNIVNVVQVSATVVYSSISFFIMMFLHNYIPYASKTTKYKFYILYGLLHANLTISYVYEAYLTLQGLQWTLSKVVYGLILFSSTNTALRMFYTYQVKMIHPTYDKDVRSENLFDFWPSFNNIYQFLVLGVYYIALDPAIILALTVVISVLVMILDKWFILKYTKTSPLQSFETGFYLYLVIPINLILRHFNTTYFVQCALMQLYNPSSYESLSAISGTVADISLVFWIITFGFGVYLMMRDISNQANAQNRVSYESVMSSFKSFYLKEYPFYELLASKSSSFDGIENENQ